MAPRSPSVRMDTPLWGVSHHNASLSTSHATGGFAVNLGPQSVIEADDHQPGSATLGITPSDTNSRAIQGHATFMASGPSSYDTSSPSFADSSPFDFNSSGPEPCETDPGNSDAFLSENSSSVAKPWDPLNAIAVLQSSPTSAPGPLPDHNSFLSPVKSKAKNNSPHSFKDSALGTEERSQYDTQSQMSQPLVGMASQMPTFYPAFSSHHEPEEVAYTDEDIADRSETASKATQKAKTRTDSKNKQDLICEICKKSVKTPSDMKKHVALHELPYLCDLEPCKRGDKGFATVNDLNRHKKSVHKIQTGSKDFKCFAPGCPKAKKIWPRLDNFKQHLLRLHKAIPVDELLKMSYDWYEKKYPEGPIQSSAVHNELLAQLAQEPKVAEKQKNKRPRTTRQQPHDRNDQLQQVDPNKRSRGNRRTGPSELVSQNVCFSLSPSTPSRRRPEGLRTNLAATAIAKHDRPTSVRRSGANVAGRSSVPALFSPALSTSMSRSHSMSEQQAPNHHNCNLTNSAQEISFLTANFESQPYQWPQRDHQLQFPAIPQRALSMLGHSHFNYPMFGLDDDMQPVRIQQQAHTIADAEELHRLQDIHDQLESLSWMPDQLAHADAEYDLADGNSALAGVGVGVVSSTIPDTTSPLVGHYNEPTTTPSVRARSHELDPRASNPELALIRNIRTLLDDYEAELINGFGQLAMAGAHDQHHPVLRQKILELLNCDDSATSDASGRTTGARALHQRISSSSLPGETQSLKDRTCHICGKVKKLRCDLKKHMKRHLRPYGCVIDHCFKTFGSKNDWKRHEGIHLPQAQCFRCDGGHSCTDSEGAVVVARCQKVFYGDKEEYCRHLIKCGVPYEMVDDIAKRRLIRNNNQGGFWCGFCNDIVRHHFESMEAVIERRNHIDRHFHDGELKASDWVELGGEGKKKSDIQQEQEEEREQEPDLATGQDESSALSSSASPSSQSQSQPSQQTTQTQEVRSQRQAQMLERQISSSTLSSQMQRGEQQRRWQQGQTDQALSSQVQQPEQQIWPQQQQQDLSKGYDQRTSTNFRRFVVCCTCNEGFYPAFGRRCVQCDHEWCKTCSLDVRSLEESSLGPFDED